MFLYKNADKNYLVIISNVNRYKNTPIYPSPYKIMPDVKDQKMSIMPPIYYDTEDTTLITVLDLKDISNPKIVKQFEVAGNTLTSRLKDDKFYLINNKGTKYYIMERTNNIDNNMIPYYIDYGNEAVKKEFDIKDIRYNEKNIDGSYTIISQFNLNTMDIQNQAVLGYFENIYMSLDNIYLTTTRTSYMEESPFRIRINSNYYEKTLVYRFGIDKNVEYKGNALVDGRIINQFSMDEYNGYFRIATTESNMQSNGFESTNNVYVIDKNMNIVGTIKNIAPGERIYSTRFMKDKLYMVTFKQVDPLFVIDLKTPSEPKILGFLKIPGYSTYLHPYDENTIIGFGMETDNEGDRVFNKGMKVALFDVSNVNEPKQKASLEIGGKGTYSPTLYNHKALMEYKKYNVYAFEVSETSNDDRYNLVFNGVYLLQVKDDKIEVKTKISHVENNNAYYMGYKTIFINNLMYVFSEDAVSVVNLDSMKEVYKDKI